MPDEYDDLLRYELECSVGLDLSKIDDLSPLPLGGKRYVRDLSLH